MCGATHSQRRERKAKKDKPENEALGSPLHSRFGEVYQELKTEGNIRGGM